jgi:hypothetical protein
LLEDFPVGQFNKRSERQELQGFLQQFSFVDEKAFGGFERDYIKKLCAPCFDKKR